MRCLEEPARPAQDYPVTHRYGCGDTPSRTPNSDLCLTVEMLPPKGLKAYPGNARTHSKKQIRQIAKSIKRFGFCNPVLIDDDGQIIAGHGRVEAAKLLGLLTVPTVRLSHLTEAERRAYILADNRLAEKAGWDREILAIELQALIDLDFEVELTGFETAEIDLCLEEAREASDDTGGPEDVVPAYTDAEAVSRPGDLWPLAPIYCCAVTPEVRKPTDSCSATPRLRSSSPTLPTIYPSTATSADSAVSGTAASPWAAVR
jgi:hypothetical protein